MLLGKRPLGTVAALLGLPSTLTAFTRSWGEMIGYNTEFLCNDRTCIHYDYSGITDHGPSRNSLVARFVGDWLIQFDADHQFDCDIVGRLLYLADKYEIDVLSAFYLQKHDPYIPVLYEWRDEDGSAEQILKPIANWPKDVPVVQIGAGGGGCLFVRRSVFNKIDEQLGERAFDKCKNFSEDLSFFYRCKKLDIKCFLATNVRTDHLRVTPVTPDLFCPDELEVSKPFQVLGYK